MWTAPLARKRIKASIGLVHRVNNIFFLGSGSVKKDLGVFWK